METPTDGPAGVPGADAQALRQLERQVERGSLFTHAAMDRVAARLQETESVVMGLVEMLQAKGILAGEEVEEVVEESSTLEEAPIPTPGIGPDPHAAASPPAPPAQENEPASRIPEPSGDESEEPQQALYSWPSVALAVDPVDPPAPAYVNCAERMHICHAVCCKLNFALTVTDIEAAKVKWDLGFPFMIRHEEDGYCTHLERGSGGCGVYADRPNICRRYSCVHDARIWKDFDKMELNQEYLDRYVSGEHRIRVRSTLPMMGSQSLASAPEEPNPDQEA